MYSPRRSAPLLLLLSFLLFLNACTATRPYRQSSAQIQDGAVKDLSTFPQDLMVYAKLAGEDANLLSPAQLAAQDARFNRIFFGPWHMSKASIKPKAFRNTFGKARGFDGVQPWTTARWEALKRNADIAQYPSRKTPAITVRHTNLRELPTHSPRFSKPTPDPAADPFDYFQYSSLALGTPLFITHATRDRQWYFVENPIAGGWVPAADVAPVDGMFVDRYERGRYAAVIRDQVALTSERGESLGRVHIGALFPVAGTAGDNIIIHVPVREASGQAGLTRVTLTDADAVIKPLPVMPKLMAVIGNGMMGQPYGWGGMHENRDCSSTLRDLFTPFGIWLPRNSAAQARSGRFMALDTLTPESKEQTILSEGTPFMTLLWMRGHVGLYVGKYKNRAAFFHNVWGVRVEDGDDDRHVIGRCVVTSLEPGKELPNAVPEGAILNRIRGMSTLPGAI